MNKILNKMVYAIVDGNSEDARLLFNKFATERLRKMVCEREEDDDYYDEKNYDKRKGGEERFTREIDETVKIKILPSMTAEIKYFGTQDIIGFETNETSDSPAWYEDTHRDEIKVQSVYAMTLNGETAFEDRELLKNTTASMLLSDTTKYARELFEATMEFHDNDDDSAIPMNSSLSKVSPDLVLLKNLVKEFAKALKEEEKLS